MKAEASLAYELCNLGLSAFCTSLWALVLDGMGFLDHHAAKFAYFVVARA